MDLPEIARPPYRDEPSIDDGERARRLACRVVIMSQQVTLPRRLLARFSEVARELADWQRRQPEAERSAIAGWVWRAANAERDEAEKGSRL